MARRVGFRKRLLVPALAVFTQVGLAATLPAQNRHDSLPDHWQLRLERLRVIIASENSLVGNGDEPYLAVIGFKSTLGEAKSTRIFWNRNLRELDSGMNRGDEVAIPQDMGVVDFGPTDGVYGPKAAAGNPTNTTLYGAVVVALESDNTPFGTMEGIFDDLAQAIQELLEKEWEPGSAALLDPVTRDAAIQALRCSIELSLWEKAWVFFQSTGDPDDFVKVQTFFYVATVQPAVCDTASNDTPPNLDRCKDPVLTRTRPWESGAPMVGEQTFDLTLNAVRFDGRVAPGTPPSPNCEGEQQEPEGIDAVYTVGGRMTSAVQRGGYLNLPDNRSNQWNTVAFEAERCSGCHPVSQVYFYARYDTGDGLGPRPVYLGSGTPDPNHPRKFLFSWNIAGVAPQDAQVWAEFSSNSFGGSVRTSEYTIHLNRETTPPSGALTSPMTGAYYGATMRVTASVTDSQSGLDHVEFYLTTASGMRFDAPFQGTAANGYSGVWNIGAVPEGPVTVCAEAVDRQGNRSNAISLPCVANVQIDHTPPTVASIVPSPVGPNATWIRSSVSTMLRASATDAGGIRSVSFSAWYDDASGAYGAHTIGRGSRLASGEYQISWTVSGIPDQADGGRHRLFVDVTAVDTAGNSSFATGWLAGFDRQLPTVRVSSPASSIRVSGGSLAVAAQASDNLGVGNVVARLTVVARYRETAAGAALDHTLADRPGVTAWSGSINLTTLPEQTLSITATAWDTAGNTSFHAQTVTIDRTAPVFSGVSTSAQPFNAGAGRTMSFNYTVSERASVTISIRDAAGTVVRSLRFIDVATSPQSSSWDGRNDAGAFVASGAYAYRLDAVDAAGNGGAHPGGSLNVVVDTTPPVVTVAFAPNPYRLSGPNLDIRYQQNEAARTEVEILDGATVVRYLGALDSAAGLYNRLWDGLNSLGQRVAAPRQYTIRVRATDAAGNRTVVTAAVDVQP